MSFKKPSQRRLGFYCAEVDEDDGVDPRELVKKYQRASLKAPRDRTNSARKAWQLCRQVAETLAFVFADQPDEVIRDLLVVSVEPAPNTSRLLVTVHSPTDLDGPHPDEILDRLARASGRLRTEVAAAITRKKSPTLSFRYAAVFDQNARRPE